MGSSPRLINFLVIPMPDVIVHHSIADKLNRLILLRLRMQWQALSFTRTCWNVIFGKRRSRLYLKKHAFFQQPHSTSGHTPLSSTIPCLRLPRVPGASKKNRLSAQLSYSWCRTTLTSRRRTTSTRCAIPFRVHARVPSDYILSQLALRPQTPRDKD